jgi:uncharacterized repeat protein (TIGR03803 family)
MRTRKLSRSLYAPWPTVFAIMMFTLLPGTPALAQEHVLYSFGSGTDGLNPDGSLIFGASGNLYGTTLSGGTYGRGTVFELSPDSLGGYTETLLHSFSDTDGDGAAPPAGLVIDAVGNLYGTTQQGGVFDYGTVFELSPESGGAWSTKILHSFNQSPKSQDGWGPLAGLVRDSSGNLYGTTEFGGNHNAGAVFEVSPQPGGNWSEKVIHSFGNVRKDGTNPFDSLIFDSSGNLYGTTVAGGNKLYGTVFELSPNSSGSWTEKVLYNFSYQSLNGDNPYGSLVFDAAGNLYGTTFYGGAKNVGVVFELTPATSGEWTEQVLHSFNNTISDGDYPDANLIFDAAGNLYGTTIEGGHYGGGVAFELQPSSTGWIETVLHNFGAGTDGILLSGGLIFDASGNLYGLSGAGGAFTGGTAFEITR